MSLAQQGFAVVNFSYRLASKYKFPAPLEDTNRVFVWLLAHAVRYGFDTHNVFGVGDNAGVHLLALYGACCTNPAYAALFTVRPPAGFVPWAVALNCGVYCVEMSNKKDLTTRLMADYLPGKGTAEELEQMDVFSHLTAAFPPAFVMTAEGNFLAPQAGLLAERLQAVGARAEYHYCGDAGHVLGHVFHCNISSEYARCCNREGCDFFKAWRGERGSFHQSIQNEPASAFVWWCTNSGALLLQKNVRT